MTRYEIDVLAQIAREEKAAAHQLSKIIGHNWRTNDDYMQILGRLEALKCELSRYRVHHCK